MEAAARASFLGLRCIDNMKLHTRRTLTLGAKLYCHYLEIFSSLIHKSVSHKQKSGGGRRTGV